MEKKTTGEALNEKIDLYLDKLEELDPASEQAKAIAELLDKLYSHSVEFEQIEADKKTNENKNQADKIKAITNIVVGVGSIASYIWMGAKTFQFEETGTIRTKCFPGVRIPGIQKLF